MTFHGLRMKWRALVRRRTVEHELDEELRFHLEQETARHLAAGVAPDEARRRARAAFGGVDAVKEMYRDDRGDRWWTDLQSDLRFGLRLLRRNPSLTATVTLTLSVGMGATVAIFSAISAVLLRPLPFAEPERLVALWEDNVDKGWKQQIAAPANMLDWQEQVRAFAGVAGWADFIDRPVLTGNGQPQSLRGVAVTGDFFGVLGAPMTLGRAFEANAHWLPHPRVVVLSHGFWRDRFGGDSAIVGRTVTLDGQSAQVVGIAAEGFAFPFRDAQLWYPMRWNPEDRAQVWFRRAHWVRPIARLKPGVTVEQAQAELAGVMQQLEERFPETNTNMKAGLGPLQDFLVGSTRRPLTILLASTGLLLLLACANIGNLLLVRATGRENEVVLRRTLGARPSRIVRQAISESAMVALLGAVGGWLLGAWGTRVLVALQPAGLLPVSDVRPDLRVFGLVVLLTAASAVLVGLLPALWMSRRDAASTLRPAARGTASRRTLRWVDGLAAFEVALAVMLTVAGGLLLRSYQRLRDVHPGVEVDGVAATAIALGEGRYGTAESRIALYDRLLADARAIPGVSHAALTTILPMSGGGFTTDFSIRGRPPEASGREVRHRHVTADYFTVVRLALKSGRVFTSEDTRTSEPVVVVNQALADKFFPGQDPVGQYISNDLVPDSSTRWKRIIGVTGNEYGASFSAEPGLEMIEPLVQETANWAYLTVRSTGEAGSVLRSLERAVSATDPMMAPMNTTTLAQVRTEVLARDRFIAILLGVFALAGALLAAVGVYGVVAQVTQRRLPEMQIRLALGA
jgi:predicted permease